MTNRTVTINSISESLLNPEKRFRTIRHIAPITDTYGNPCFTLASGTADFEVTLNGERHLMRIPLEWNEAQRSAASKDALSTLSPQATAVASCRYYNRELVTFDQHGEAHHNDIILERLPSGLPLREFIRTHLGSSDRAALRQLLSGLADMHDALDAAGLTHGHLTARNIVVDTECRPIALRHIHHFRKEEGSDRRALILLALHLYTAACEPAAHIAIQELPRHERDKKMLRNLLLHAEFSRNETLLAAVKSLQMERTPDVAESSAILRAIASAPFSGMPLLSALLLETEDTPKIDYAGDIKASYYAGEGADNSMHVDFSRCDFVGALADTLIRYRKEGVWGFADREGVPVGTGYLHAADFYEGRAAVATKSGFGLIDRDGEYRMQPTYETLEWYGAEGVAAACSDGQWMLYDRQGRLLIASAYDWIADPCEEIFLVRRNGRFGYVGINGTAITEVRYEEAFSFRNGKALVRLSGESFHIDRNGKRL